MTIKPNLLGRVLRYAIDGVRYGARENDKTNTSAAGMYGLPLQAHSKASRWQSDAVDTDAAYRNAVCASWVYADLMLISRRIASAKWEVKDRQGEELIDLGNHPFERLWARPGGTFTGGLLAQYLTWWYLLRGEAFLFVSSDAPGRGEPRELWPLVASACKPNVETLRKSALTGMPIVDYAYNVGNESFLLPGENVVHFRTPNPFDYWRGLSPLSAAMDGITLDLGARRWQRDFYRNDNAIPAAVVSLPENMLPVDFDRITAHIQQDIQNGKRLFFTRAGGLSVDVIQQAMADMQFVESRAFTKGEIDKIYGVPTGLLDGGNSGDAQQAIEITFGRNTVQPMLDYFADELTAKVGPFYGEGIVIAAPSVVPQDRSLEIAEYQAYSRDRTLNENRAERSLAPIMGFPAQIGDLDITDVPVRLLELLPPGSLVSTMAGAATPAVTTPQANTPAVGDDVPIASLPQLEAPSAVTASTLAEKAAQLGIATELKRWEHVAAKEIKEGRAPGERAFESDVLPSGLKEGIMQALTLADTEADVRAAFQSPFFRQSRPRDGERGKRPERGREGSRRDETGTDSAAVVGPTTASGSSTPGMAPGHSGAQ